MSAKTAIKVATAYELTCPHCKSTLPAPCGSLFWEAIEIHTGKIVECFECGKAVKLPKA